MSVLFQNSFKINYFCRDIRYGPGVFCQHHIRIRVLNKIRSIFKGPHRIFAWFVLFTTSVFVFLWIVGPGNTVIHWAKAAIEICRQEKLIDEYQRRNDEMDRRIDMLRTDRDTLEKFAREHFNFAVPGDDVYIVEE